MSNTISTLEYLSIGSYIEANADSIPKLDMLPLSLVAPAFDTDNILSVESHHVFELDFNPLGESRISVLADGKRVSTTGGIDVLPESVVSASLHFYRDGTTQFIGNGDFESNADEPDPNSLPSEGAYSFVALPDDILQNSYGQQFPFWQLDADLSLFLDDKFNGVAADERVFIVVQALGAPEMVSRALVTAGLPNGQRAEMWGPTWLQLEAQDGSGGSGGSTGENNGSDGDQGNDTTLTPEEAFEKIAFEPAKFSQVSDTGDHVTLRSQSYNISYPHDDSQSWSTTAYSAPTEGSFAGKDAGSGGGLGLLSSLAEEVVEARIQIAALLSGTPASRLIFNTADTAARFADVAEVVETQRDTYNDLIDAVDRGDFDTTNQGIKQLILNYIPLLGYFGSELARDAATNAFEKTSTTVRYGYGENTFVEVSSGVDFRSFKKDEIARIDYFGSLDSNSIAGTDGDDRILTSDGDDYLLGNGGHDRIFAGAGHDIVYGDDGFDTIHGGEGDDILYGGEGDDILYGGLGSNQFFGGAGADTINIGSNGVLEQDTVFDFSSEDTIDISDVTISNSQLLKADSGGAFISYGNGSGLSLEGNYLGRNFTFNYEYGGTRISVSEKPKPDNILFYNEDTRTVGQLEMPNANWKGVGKAGSGWETRGTGRFDSEKTPDVLWLNTDTGNIGRFSMVDGRLDGWKGMGKAGQGWDVVGIGDFDGDGQDDVLWQNTATGGLGQFRIDEGRAEWLGVGRAGSGWEVAGTGDFNDDGIDDILWKQASTGALGQFRMSENGKTWIRLETMSDGWDVAGVGDFWGGEADDILVFNASDRALGYYDYYNDVVYWTSLGNTGQGWQIEGVADFDGDQVDDIFWRHDDGRIGQFQMDGDEYSWSSIGFAGEEWEVLL